MRKVEASTPVQAKRDAAAAMKVINKAIIESKAAFMYELHRDKDRNSSRSRDRGGDRDMSSERGSDTDKSYERDIS